MKKKKLQTVTRVPGIVKTKVTLKPRETKTVSLQLDQDMVVHNIETNQSAPFLFRVKKKGSTSEGPSQVFTQPHQSFLDYIEEELPEHLALLVEEPVSEWTQRNQDLLQTAELGDDEAFFTLLARDPRFLQSECALRRILTWRTEVDTYNRYFRNQNKLSQFWQGDTYAQQKAYAAMQQAENNLHRLGQSQLALFDQRGKRPLPPADKVRGIYYGLLCLLNGLRRLNKILESKIRSESKREEFLANFVSELKVIQGTSFFFPYILAGGYIISDQEIRHRANFHDPSIRSLLLGQGVTPSSTAKELTASGFEIHVSTVERLCALNKPILLSSTAEEDVYLGGCSNFDLLKDFPEIAPLHSALTC